MSICPHCNQQLTDEQIITLYADFCSRNLKGRTSEKKASTSAENGRKGGRPKGSKNKVKVVPIYKEVGRNFVEIGE